MLLQSSIGMAIGPICKFIFCRITIVVVLHLCFVNLSEHRTAIGVTGPIDGKTDVQEF